MPHKKSYFILLITVFFVSHFSHTSVFQIENYKNVIFYNQSPSNKHEGFGIRVGENQGRDFSQSIPESKYNHVDRAILSNMNKDDFEEMFQYKSEESNESKENEILNNYELYVFSNFRNFASNLNSYKEFMISLQNKIETDKKFRKKTSYMPGFKNSFCIFKRDKSEFHDFIKEEANKAYREIDRLHVDNSDELKSLVENYQEKANTSLDYDVKRRLENRMQAIKETNKQPKRVSIIHLNFQN